MINVKQARIKSAHKLSGGVLFLLVSCQLVNAIPENSTLN